MHSPRYLLALGALAGVVVAMPAAALSNSFRQAPFLTFAQPAQEPPSLAGFSAMKVTLSRTLIADQGKVVANYARLYGIKTIFLQISGDDVDLLDVHDPLTTENLNALFDVAHVFAVVGSPSWLDTPRTVPAIVASFVTQIAPSYPRFAGILYDITPDVSQERAYFELLDTLFGGATTWTYGTTLLEANPRWWRQPDRNGHRSPSWLQEAESYPAVKEIYLDMDGHSAESQMTHDVIKAGPTLTKPFLSGADDTTKQGNSYYDARPERLAENLRVVADRLRALNPAFAGTSLDGWADDYDAVQLTLPQPTSHQNPKPTGPLVPPPGRIYIGAFVAPDRSRGGPADVKKFETQIGRKLALDQHFRAFFKPLIEKEDYGDIANGRVPSLGLDCGTTDANIAQGNEDAQLQTLAAAAKSFAHPIFLRFFWEMNLPLQTSRKECWDPLTDLPGYRLSPAWFIAAWRHMHAVFVAAGATNVIWVWNESGAGPIPAAYYPGDDVVDWVGVDYYDRNNGRFLSDFVPLLNSISQYDKPLMIGETGAQPQIQPSYFSEIAESLGAVYPQIKSIAYFDSSGGLTSGNWTLSPKGIAAYGAMGRRPYFSAMPQL